MTERPGVASDYQYDNGYRELQAYRSGMLADLAPGIAAPVAYAAIERGDGTLTLWLEDVTDQEPWTRDTFVQAARHLGRLAGRWLGGTPDHPWLFHGWIERHSQPAAMEHGVELLLGAVATPAIQGRLGWRLEEAVQLVEAQAAFGALLQSLPQTLCHHDAGRANLFARNSHRSPETVLIDWEMVGPGPIAADLVSLLFASVRRGDLSAAWLPALRPRAMEAYASGLEDVGAVVDPAVMRLGFSAAAALRWTLVRDVVAALGGGPIHRGSAPGETSETALEELLALTRELFEVTADARRAIRG